MKKLFALLLAVVLMLTLSACAAVPRSTTDPLSPDKADEKAQVQNDTAPANQTAEQLISRDKAIEIALEHVGFDKTQVTELEAELDREVTVTEWDVDFKQGGYEYSYDINAQTGEIIKFDKELD